MCKTEIEPEGLNNSCLCYNEDQGKTLNKEDQIARLKNYRTEMEAEIASVEERVHQIKKEEGKEDV